ncbi:MAG TPA: hypothetical protein VGJ87_00525, partial [Roseiflexaceae bacterium]
VRPGGSHETLTVLFADLAGFTALSEKLGGDIVRVLILLSQKVAGGEQQDFGIEGDSLSNRGRRWVDGGQMTVNRGLRPMSRGLSK